MSLRTFLIGIGVLSFQVCISQDFKSYKEIKALMNVNIAQLEDSLIKRGFQFEKSEGNLFRYKKNSNSIEFNINPKEISYTFSDRSLYLKTFSDIETEGFEFVKEVNQLGATNSQIKAEHLQKNSEHIYLWSYIDGPSQKTMYAIRILVDNSDRTTNKENTKSESSKMAELKLAEIKSLFQKPLIQNKDKEEIKIKTDTTRLGNPKLLRFNVSIGVFDFRDPGHPNDGFNQYANYQIGFQKSRYHKIKDKKKWLSDTGAKMDLAYMPGLTYGPADRSWYIQMWKVYLVYNQYTAFNLKYFDLVIQAGVFLNYNYGVGNTYNSSENVSAGFLSKGFHFGEQIQRGIGKKSKYGYPKKLIGLGFDHYFDTSGSYIGSFGLSFGF